MQRKKDGFKDERYIIIPTESFTEFAKHPLVKSLYLTDVGFFPSALHHYRERKEGIEEVILIYCVSGKGFIEVEDQISEISEKSAFCIPSNKKHRYYASEENAWSIFWVHFKGEAIEYFPVEELKVLEIASENSNSRIMYFFELLFQVLERNYTIGNFIYLSQVLSLMLSELYFKEKGKDQNIQNAHLTKIIHFMYRNLHQRMTLEEIAAEAQLSKSYVNYIFNEYAQKSPIDFLIHIKMQEACKLLKSIDSRVSEVAVCVGYDDPYYFSRIFKKVIGVSPRDYKNGNYIPEIKNGRR